MMERSPQDVIEGAVRQWGIKVCADKIAQHCVDDLRAAGWIVVRHDAIRLAQAHAAAEVRSGRRDKVVA